MDQLKFDAPVVHCDILADLRKVPFAKTDDGYQFAFWVYDLNDTEEKREQILESYRGEEAAALLEKAKTELEAIIVSEDDYLTWTVHKKDAGGIAQYHKVIHDLSIGLFMLNIDYTAEDIIKAAHGDAEAFYTGGLQRNDDNNVRQVLNRNNPFADVTIKSQQFFYKTADGGTETLFFSTNNIVEKVDKNGRDMLTMRPGFSVTKEHDAVQRPMQKVTFANSVTEPIVEDNDHIYIHID